jgi:hypothetical protein
VDEGTVTLRENESRKLLATYLNNLSVAFFVAAVIQPALFVVQQGGRVTWLAVLLVGISLALSGGFVAVAHAVVRRLRA